MSCYPGDDGFTLCQRVRKQSNVPIIMLTAVSDETDQIIGLEIGADDYIAKPFSPRQFNGSNQSAVTPCSSSR